VKNAPTERKVRLPIILLLSLPLIILAALAGRVPPQLKADSPKAKIFAQSLVEQTLAKHSELAGVELATTPLDGGRCVTIAATDTKEIGGKCDSDEFGVMKSGKPTVEKESDGYDVTLPLHVEGKTIGTIALDFKPGEKEVGLLERANAIATELENQVPVKTRLFEPVK
jgi:hypothetical protein